jgi:hypothetical protein
VLSATRKNNRTKVQAALLGSTAAIRRYQVTLGRKTVQLNARPTPFTVTLRRRGARVTVAALDAGGRVVAVGRRPVTRLRMGKGGVGTGGGVGA